MLEIFWKLKKLYKIWYIICYKKFIENRPPEGYEQIYQRGDSAPYQHSQGLKRTVCIYQTKHWNTMKFWYNQLDLV